MPERQSSPGEVTARTETDVTENDSSRGSAAQERPADSAGGTDDVAVAEQVAAQVAASPPATEPRSAEPTAVAPTGDEPVLDVAAAVEMAQPGPEVSAGAAAPPQPAPPARPAEQAQPGPLPQRPAPAPSARPRPRPRPAPEGDTGDESPTVRTAVGGSAAAEDEIPTVRTAVGSPTPGSPAPGSTADRARAGGAPAHAAATGVPPASARVAPAQAPTVAVRAAGASAAAPPARPAPRSSAAEAWFNPVDNESTQLIPRTPLAPAGPPAPAADPPTERLSVIRTTASPDATATSVVTATPANPGRPGLPPTDGPEAGRSDAGERPPRRRRILLLTGVVGALAVLYVGDLVLSSGSVPRGVSVVGVQVGGLGLDEAEQRLRGEIEPRTHEPIQVSVGEARSEIDAAAAGLSVDWPATLAVAGSQPLNPITRITSFFTHREIGVVTTSNADSLTAALEELSPIVDKAPVEGSVRFEGATPVPVDPVPGQRLDVPAAAGVLQRDWASGRLVALPLNELPPSTTPEDVVAAIEQVARPAVSAPVTMIGEGGAQGTVQPEVIASALTFRADGDRLVPEINPNAVTDALKPQLASSERPGRDASLDFSSGTPVVVPSQDGRGVDYTASLAKLLDVLTGTGPRQLTAVYADQPAELTTEKLNGLGITGVIGEFTTGGFAADSGRNIKRGAEQINGMIVEPGETFSLNGATGSRNASNGYVEAGIISDGHASRGIGGGVSQLATTLYNASYFAGMVDVAHKEHSFYISRYPAGREATVFEGAIDLKFRNDNPTGVLIQTVWTPSSLTVRLYGTKVYDVTSTPGPRTKPTSPNTITIPAGQPCSPSQGAPGFTVTDTRTLRKVSTGESRNETRTVRYNPSPIVVCGG
ncbi:MAG: VanW family protein [Pseudonocardia sp.]|jgi:vancomycin resistance protein YoaR|nr:VanW family protein [Pseudonocardia sp.]